MSFQKLSTLNIYGYEKNSRVNLTSSNYVNNYLFTYMSKRRMEKIIYDDYE